MESSTEILRKLLDERGVEHFDSEDDTTIYYADSGYRYTYNVNPESGWAQLFGYHLTPEQAIAATLGRAKAKSHPYGYEPDTGAFDTTRCECGCINDISATYCNDCGGEIEIDMDAEKEIYHTPAHRVFVEKHDDGSLEFAGKRYIAATLGSEQPPVDKLIRCLENDYGITASWDGLRKVWLTERATLGRGTCELHDCEGSFSALNRPVWRCDCGAFMTQYTDATTYHKPRFCPNCGRKAVSA